MSSPFSLGKSLEQLKVTELKEELRKRGLGLKGVKKELLERLEEAIKKEQSNVIQGGFSQTTNQVLIDNHFPGGDFSPQASNQVLMNTNLDGRAQQKQEYGEIDAGASKSALQDYGLDGRDREEVHDVFQHEEKGAFVDGKVEVNEVHGGVSSSHYVNLQEESAMEISSVSLETSLEGSIQHEEPQRSDYNDVKVELLYSSNVTSEVKEDDLPSSSGATGEEKGNLSVSYNDPNDVKDELPLVDNITVVSVDVTETITSSNLTELVNVNNEDVMENKIEENASVVLTDISNRNNNAVEEYVSTVVVDGGLVSQDELPSSLTREDGGADTQASNINESTVLESNAKDNVDDYAMEDAETLNALKEAAEDPDYLNEAVPNVTNGSPENEQKFATKIETVRQPLISSGIAEEEEKLKANYRGGIEDHSRLIENPPETTKMEIKSEDIVVPKEDAMDIEKPEGRSKLIEPEKSQELFDDTKQVLNKYEDEKRSGRISEDEWKKDMKEFDDKLSSDQTGNQAGQKRKDDGSDYKQQEPAKRVRKWNSGNDLQMGTDKPLTMDIVKEITSVEAKQGSSVGVSKSSLKTTTTSKPLVTVAKSEPDVNGTKREVPPPSITPTTSLKIERFVRPFTLKAVRDMLAEFGQCSDFWMDQIKTHCYITYFSVEEATAARNGLYNKQWPPSFGNLLVADFVDPNEVKAKCQGLPEKINVTSQTLIPQGTISNNPLPQPTHKAPLHSHSNVLPPPPPPPLRERIQQVHRKDPEPQVPTLDDLFYKTKAKPHIYYLPLTEEQVAQKVAMKQNNDKDRQLNMKPLDLA